MNGFKIISKLGEGAYSTVLKVKRLADDNIYALKKVKLLKLSNREKTNALNEVRILASVKSNFVISYKEAFFDEKESCLGIVMEFADNGDLYQKITKYRKLKKYFEETEIWRILIQLIKGLKSLHELKILHRDLKSANVFLFNDGSAKLGDLNVSKIVKKGLVYTQTGTPYYASPEVWKDLPYDNKSDIWSLGCVLYEMITLKPPFRAENMEGLYNKVIKGVYQKIPDIYSNDLSEVISLLIQVDSNKRPSCENLLKNPIIQKRIEYFKSFSGDDIEEDQCLLRTITIPKNLLFLSANLPKSNYSINKNNLTEINNCNVTVDNDKINISCHKHKNSDLNYSKSKFRESKREKEERLIKEKENEMKKKEEKIKKELEDTKAKNRRVEEYLRKVDEENEKKRRELAKKENSLSIDNKDNKLKLPDIRNNYDNSNENNILHLHYRKPNSNNLVLNYNHNNRNKKYKVSISDNDEIYKLYKMYAPQIQRPHFQYGKYNVDKHKENYDNYIKSPTKPYNYYNIYQPSIRSSNRNNYGQKINLIQRNLLN